MASCFNISCNDNDNDNYNDNDFQELLSYIILNFGPDNCDTTSYSTKKQKIIYRKQAIIKWLKKREKRTFAVYKVKNQNFTKRFIRDNNTGKYITSTINFISVTEL